MNFWQFAHEHWLVLIILALIAGSVLKNLFMVPVRIVRLKTRSKNIGAHGWPTNPLMDADGDIIHPPAPTQEAE